MLGDIMFYKYEIKNNELYLYLTMNYEFSNEFGYNSDSNLNKITLDLTDYINDIELKIVNSATLELNYYDFGLIKDFNIN